MLSSLDGGKPYLAKNMFRNGAGIHEELQRNNISVKK